MKNKTNMTVKQTVLAGSSLILVLFAATAGAQVGTPSDTGGAAAEAGVGNALTNGGGGGNLNALMPGVPSQGPGSLPQAYKDYSARHFPEAAAALQTIVQKAPNSLPAHQMLADIYLQQNKIPQAIPEMEAVLRLDPKDLATRGNLGIAYLQNGSYDKAATLYRNALMLTPKDPKLNMQLGMALERSGDHAGAAAAFETAATLDPKDSRAPYYAGMLYHQTGSDAKAVPLLQKALTLGTPEKFNVYTALAETDTAAKKTDDALRDYTLAAQAKPDDFATQANLGVLNQNAGRKADAEAAYRKALTLTTSNLNSQAEVQSNLALLLTADGKLDEAAALLVQAAQAVPTDAHFQENLGLVYEKQNKTDLAAAAFGKALAIDPTFTEAKESLARLKK